MKDGQGIDDQEERIKNKKYRSLKMFPSHIILKFKNIVKFNQNKLLKLKNFSFDFRQSMYLHHLDFHQAFEQVGGSRQIFEIGPVEYMVFIVSSLIRFTSKCGVYPCLLGHLV